MNILLYVCRSTAYAKCQRTSCISVALTYPGLWFHKYFQTKEQSFKDRIGSRNNSRLLSLRNRLYLITIAYVIAIKAAISTIPSQKIVGGVSLVVIDKKTGSIVRCTRALLLFQFLLQMIRDAL